MATKAEVVGKTCPLCGSQNTIQADFDSRYCGSCDFYWWFWLDMDRLIEAKANLLASMKRDKERFNIPAGYISKCELNLRRLKENRCQSI